MTTAIEVTPAAEEKIRQLQGDDPERAVVRLYVAGRGCCRYQYGMSFVDKPGAGDDVSSVGELQFAVDEQSQAACNGASIDFVETPAGAGFRVVGPILAAGCACGNS